MTNRFTTFLTIIFVTSLLLPLSVFAQGMNADPTPEPVDYTMPYPGLLPDNPLYSLKIFRDQFITFLLSNPVKKGRFELLQADKHIQAGYLLISKENKGTLAVTTISKGNNYFDMAIGSITDAKKQGMDIGDLLQQLSRSNLKHTEILTSILPEVKGSDKTQLKSELGRIQIFQKRLEKMNEK